jgi:transposase-like protein
MPPTKSGSNLRQITHWQKAAARAEYLRHPDASISEVAKATNVALRTVARAREQLVKEGLLAPGRNATPLTPADAITMAVDAKAEADAFTEPKPRPAASRGSKPGETIDGEAFRQMNEMLDELADEDDETTRKRMLRQVKKFAFDPNLHPDTRMSASQLWAKLLDMQRSKDLGPGKPLTFDAAVLRATEFLQACGAKVAVPAFYKAFDIGEPPDGNQSAQAMEQGVIPSTPTGLAGPPNNDGHPQVQA